jgi:hypothetical protein
MAAAIWVDADACPRVLRDVLVRAAERTGVAVTFVANQALALPRVPSVRMLVVPSGFDVADGAIVERVGNGDLVVTGDLPLASAVIDKGAAAISPRGERYTADTIRSLLSIRDFMDTMRASGAVGGGPPPLGAAERQAFAGHLDRWLAHRQRD